MKIRILVGISFVSSATLCLEITLTRYFSVSQHYHFAFLVVSMAFLGYGAAGSFLSVFPRIHRRDRDTVLAWTALLYALTLFFSFLASNAIPFDAFKLAWDIQQLGYVFLFYILLCLPFFFAGMIISSAITRTPGLVSTIYFSDLFGATAGTLLTLVIFFPRGDRGVIPLLSALPLGAALFFSSKKMRTLRLLAALLLIGAAVLLLRAPSWLSFRMSAFKALPIALKYPGAKPLFTRWNALSRVDVLDSPAVRYAPGMSLLYTGRIPDQLGLCVDGSQLNAVTRVRDWEAPELDFFHYLPSCFPYRILANPSVLILEAQGGLDAAAAVHFGASRIKIVEDNPLVARILREDLSGYSGHLLSHPRVELVVANSRSALKREKGRFDLIVFALTDVFGASATGQEGFGEKYLFTVESFLEALRNLTPSGMASMTVYLLPPPRQEVRLWATWVEALSHVTDQPEAHLAALRSWGTISFFVKKSPLSPQDIRALKKFAAECLFDLVYYPGITPEEVNLHNRFQEPLYYDMAVALLQKSTREEFFKQYLFHVKPVTDNRPFFFNVFKITKIPQTYEALGRKWLPFLQSEWIVPVLLIQVMLAAFLLILLPLLALRREKSVRSGRSGGVLAYFALIGMSFMLVEITLIQKGILFLGHPLLSVALVIALLLGSSGLGSLFSRKIPHLGLRQKTRFLLLGLSGVVLLEGFGLLPAMDSWIGLRLGWRILVSAAAIFPLGFLMGIPFPSGIRLLRNGETRWIPWAWAVNAFSSVGSSALAFLVAFLGGYSLVWAIAGGGYFLGALFLRFSHHRDKPDA